MQCHGDLLWPILFSEFQDLSGSGMLCPAKCKVVIPTNVREVQNSVVHHYSLVAGPIKSEYRGKDDDNHGDDDLIY